MDDLFLGSSALLTALHETLTHHARLPEPTSGAGAAGYRRGLRCTCGWARHTATEATEATEITEVTEATEITEVTESDESDESAAADDLENSWNLHLANALHAEATRALQPLVVRRPRC